ncbi:hypothetical protein C0989_009158 [Termitomyces sp. Mn162]|nr:hypothetical protein C0989_009158 [Termitomyces sp. Mn162]
MTDTWAYIAVLEAGIVLLCLLITAIKRSIYLLGNTCCATTFLKLVEIMGYQWSRIPEAKKGGHPPERNQFEKIGGGFGYKVGIVERLLRRGWLFSRSEWDAKKTG